MDATATFNTQQPVSLNDEIAQRRILWIVVASGVFLLAVLGAACILYSSPKKHAAPANIIVKDEPAQRAEYEGISEFENPYLQGAEGTVPEQGFALPNDTLYPNAAYADATPHGTSAADSNYYANGTSFDLSTIKNSEPSPVTPINQAAADSIHAADTKKNQAAQKAQPAITPAPSVAASSTTAQAAGAASGMIADRFWVQAASFTSKKKADSAREILFEKQIQAEVFTYDSKGTLYYRVRVGPYTTKSEAEYWQKRIKELSEFKEAFITNSSAPAKN